MKLFLWWILIKVVTLTECSNIFPRFLYEKKVPKNEFRGEDRIVKGIDIPISTNLFHILLKILLFHVFMFGAIFSSILILFFYICFILFIHSRVLSFSTPALTQLTTKWYYHRFSTRWHYSVGNFSN
jgi:hypothetical protein